MPASICDRGMLWKRARTISAVYAPRLIVRAMTLALITSDTDDKAEYDDTRAQLDRQHETIEDGITLGENVPELKSVSHRGSL